MTNGTVSSVQPQANNTYFTVTGTDRNDKVFAFNARKVVLATGLRDLLPETPGIRENWGQGIYWCPWCDGHEHADQPLGLLGPLGSVPDTVREILSLNKDIIAFVNGTDTTEACAANDNSFPSWDKYLNGLNVIIDNRTISSLERLRDGREPNADPSIPSHPEHDLFRVHFTEGEPVTRAAFLTSFGSGQYSSLGKDLGLRQYGSKLAADPTKGLVTSVPGIYAIGDCNSDNVTNVPHALFTGKRTAVYLHGKRFHGTDEANE